MATTDNPGLYNPGELVFDQETGEPYIDENGAMVDVSPGSIVSTPDGRTLSGDNTANAAYLRASIFQGEVWRDASVGVPYNSQVLGQSNVGLAVTAVVSEVRERTPGVRAVLGVRVDTYDPATRILRFTASLLTAAGATVPVKITAIG